MANVEDSLESMSEKKKGAPDTPPRRYNIARCTPSRIETFVFVYIYIYRISWKHMRGALGTGVLTLLAHP